MKTIKIKANNRTYLVKANDSSEAMQKLVESGEIEFVDSAIKDSFGRKEQKELNTLRKKEQVMPLDADEKMRLAELEEMAAEVGFDDSAIKDSACEYFRVTTDEGDHIFSEFLVKANSQNEVRGKYERYEKSKGRTPKLIIGITPIDELQGQALQKRGMFLIDEDITEVEVKDAYVDVDRIADYLWTWTDDSENPARDIFYEKLNKSHAPDEKSARAEAGPEAKKLFTNYYKMLKTIVNNKIEKGYKQGLDLIDKLTNK